ncbi:hypothetical protein [Dactylosporangium sp. NPDC049140]|uniref:hypothetical protein n=1 Tax=Dactylosporangium sp. NPDC049140 TaxID=3155647 RepID=UPI00340418E0
MTDPHHHAALLYDDADDLRAAFADRADGELVVLACRPEHNRLLAVACPGALLQPRPETFRRPVAALAAVRRLLRQGFTVRLATAIAPELARQTYGAIARAEVAQARVDFRQVRSRAR